MFKKNSNGIYQFEELIRPNLIHGYSTVEFGNMSYKYGPSDEEVNKNRLAFAKAVGINENKVAQMGLIHGTQVEVVRNDNIGTLTTPKYFEGVDGVVTNIPGISLFILTGDCAPILLYDPQKKVIGLVHSGWMGTVGKISVLAVARMLTEFQSNLEDIRVGIGPTIEKCCYQKRTQGLQQFLPEWEGFWEKQIGDTVKIDINGFTINELKKLGVPAQNIFYSNFCTKDHRDEFFSQQAEKAGLQNPGRFASVIQLK